MKLLKTVPMRDQFAKWIAACTVGELLGFGAAAAMAWLTFVLVGSDPVSWHARVASLGLMVLAGVAEGAVLGVLQWAVLRKIFPDLRPRSWLGATITVAALGWFLGMLPSTLMSPSQGSGAVAAEPPWVVVLIAAMAFGAVAGAAFGFAQWLVLRRYAHDATRWIWANAVGWAIGLPWSFLAGSIADLRRSVPFAIFIGAIAGAFMGASVALVTGRALMRIRPHEDARRVTVPHGETGLCASDE